VRPSTRLDRVRKRKPPLADELEHGRCDERLRRAADAEAVVRAHRTRRRQVRVAAREADRPFALADERDRPGRAGGDELVERVLKLRLTGGAALASRSGRYGQRGRDGEQSEDRDRSHHELLPVLQ
jgi:hypothetical protein